jgi:hypothetical protein
MDAVPDGWSAVATGSHRARERLIRLAEMRGCEVTNLMVWKDKPRSNERWGPIHFQIIPSPMVEEATLIVGVKPYRVPAGRISRPWSSR